MGRAKEIIVKVIPSKIANAFVKKNHYSGKVVANSTVHFGCFLDDKLHGVMSYGNSMQKSSIVNLVSIKNKTSKQSWNCFLELNRMAFDDYLPKYSESRCIAISLKLIKKNAPHIKWIISYADGTQCGDGTIYRASGFQLTGINKNTTMLVFEDGEVVSNLSCKLSPSFQIRRFGKVMHGEAGVREAKKLGAKKLAGNMLRYVYLIDKDCKINVPIIKFSEIDKAGAGMYKGEKITLKERKENKRD